MTNEEILKKLSQIEFTLFTLNSESNVSKEEIESSWKLTREVMENLNKKLEVVNNENN